MQLAEKQREFSTISTQFEQLKTDFRYNLGLLSDRDAELEKFDASHALLTATLEDRDRQLAEIQKLHAEATSGAHNSRYIKIDFLCTRNACYRQDDPSF
jgi:phage-related minor tail protein